MANNGTRAAKLADRIRVIVAETLKNRVKDPRLGFVTITDVRITGDLRDATVFYTVYGSDEERAESAAALESAKGILRTEVGRQTGVKHTPSLTFIADAIPEGARQIEDLLAKVAVSDAAVRDAAATATYAGEPDPYRARARRRVRRRGRGRLSRWASATKADDGPGGLVIVDKPAGWTSHDVVGRMRRLARTRRVGHAGTLDPMATGVLVVGVEKTTRLLGHLALTRKTYEATIRLGQSTVTDDAEGEVTRQRRRLERVR